MKANRNLSGTIFNIQKYSVNDGPGIRTVVFLKGCPLRCQWCSNPESQLPKPQILWERRKCLHCHHCVSICPQGALSAVGDRIQVDTKLCDECGKCISECPAHTLKMEGERKTVQQVLDVVMQDLPFYEESGGGITLSGGEMLMQPDFSLSLLLAAKEEGLHTCCETTGFAASDTFEKVTNPIDLILFDMKHWDAARHKEKTGVSNELPVENMRRAIEKGKDVLPRIPVIPGFNDSISDAVEFSGKLRSIGADRCQLLPFHQFGENKYDLLGKEYAYQDTAALHREELEKYHQTFIDNGIQSYF